LHLEKKSKAENIDPQNVQEHYVQYLILKSLFSFIVSMQIGFPKRKKNKQEHFYIVAKILFGWNYFI